MIEDRFGVFDIVRNLLNKEEYNMNAITLHRPGLLGHKYFEEVFDNLFGDQHFMDGAIKRSTKGYPVVDIYRDDDGSTILEFALAGFARDELKVDVQPGKRTITVAGEVDETNRKRSRIARRNFVKTYVNYDDNLDMSKADAKFENGLLTVKVPQRPEAKPISVSIG